MPQLKKLFPARKAFQTGIFAFFLDVLTTKQAKNAMLLTFVLSRNLNPLYEETAYRRPTGGAVAVAGFLTVAPYFLGLQAEKALTEQQAISPPVRASHG